MLEWLSVVRRDRRRKRDGAILSVNGHAGWMSQGRSNGRMNSEAAMQRR